MITSAKLKKECKRIAEANFDKQMLDYLESIKAIKGKLPATVYTKLLDNYVRAEEKRKKDEEQLKS